MDQIAALHWLRENIAVFGGDRDRVTVFGHGTGAACINFLMTSKAVPKSKCVLLDVVVCGSVLSEVKCVYTSFFIFSSHLREKSGIELRIISFSVILVCLYSNAVYAPQQFSAAIILSSHVPQIVSPPCLQPTRCLILTRLTTPSQTSTNFGTPVLHASCISATILIFPKILLRPFPLSFHT